MDHHPVATFDVTFTGVTVPFDPNDTYDDIVGRLVAMVQQGEFDSVDLQTREKRVTS